MEGLISHHLLDLHHVRAGPDELRYDVGLLIWGFAMIVIGVAIVRQAVLQGARPPAGTDLITHPPGWNDVATPWHASALRCDC